jgi:23S rRNA pseudouridine2605 synthase
VFDLLPPELVARRLFCVGRLDKESEGLLLLTNDGGLQQQLTHPSYNVAKKYLVEIDQPLRETDVPKLIRGIQWEGERLSLDKVFPAKGGGKGNWRVLEATLHHGKKREIRRLFYAFGYDVKRLRRVQIGNFRLAGIPRGAYRILGKGEIRALFQPPAAPPRR